MAQDTGIDWMHALTGFGGGAIGTLLTWFWRAARAEPKLQAEFKEGIQASEKVMETKIEEAKRHGEEKVDEMVGHFHESFTSMRQQISNTGQRISDAELAAERRFMAKETFDDFRDEYRQDMQRIFAKLDSIPSRRQ